MSRLTAHASRARRTTTPSTHSRLASVCATMALACGLMPVSPSQAATPILQLTTTGVVIDSEVTSVDLFGRGLGYGTLMGMAVTQVYTFHTDHPVPDTSHTPNQAIFFGPTEAIFDQSWITVETRLDGITLPTVEETRQSAWTRNTDVLGLDNGNRPDSPTGWDGIEVSQSSAHLTSSPDGSQLRHGVFSNVLMSKNADFLTSLALSSLSFNLTFTPDENQVGYVGNEVDRITADNQIHTLNYFTFSYRLQTARLEAIAATVPEPAAATLGLFGSVGLIGAIALRGHQGRRKDA